MLKVNFVDILILMVIIGFHRHLLLLLLRLEEILATSMTVLTLLTLVSLIYQILNFSSESGSDFSHL